MVDEILMQKAESLYYECHLDEAFPLFEKLAEDGSGRAMYFLGEYYNHGLGKIRNRDEKKSHFWHKKGHMAGEVLCSLNLAYELPEDSPISAFKSFLLKIFSIVPKILVAGLIPWLIVNPKI